MFYIEFNAFKTRESFCDVETAMATGRVQGAGHAGCFVRRGNQMLAVRLTYDGHWDIVGHDFSVC